MAEQLSLTLESDDTETGELTNESESNGALALRLSKTVLLGRFVSTRSYGLNFLNTHMKKLWGCRGELKITQRGFNFFFFTFQLEDDLQWVIQKAPWSFANAHLVVKQWPPHLTWEQIDLSKSCIWVQVLGLPLTQLNAKNAERVGNAFAGLLEYEISKNNVLHAPRIMYVKVEFWVDKPLLTGFNNVISNEWKPWVRFRYEDLPEFCYFCGRLGHSMVKCWVKGDDDKLPTYDISEKGFGPWLKAVIPNDRLYLQHRNRVASEPAPDNPQAEDEARSAASRGPSKTSQIWVPREKKHLDKIIENQAIENREDADVTGLTLLSSKMMNQAEHGAGHTSTALEETVGDSNKSIPADLDGHMKDVLHTLKKRKTLGDDGPSKKKSRLNTPHSGVGLSPPPGPSQGQQVEPGLPQQTLATSLGQSPLFVRRWKARARASPSDTILIHEINTATNNSS
ncbi:hypothetical protein Tsubulata_048151, partial [Turnera subulata]